MTITLPFRIGCPFELKAVPESRDGPRGRQQHVHAAGCLAHGDGYRLRLGDVRSPGIVGGQVARLGRPTGRPYSSSSRER